MGTLSSNYPNSVSVESALNRANKAEVDIDSLKTSVEYLNTRKADSSAIDGITAELEGKADKSAVDGITTELGTKADKTELVKTNAMVEQKADAADLDLVNAVVAQKADTTITTGLQEQINELINPVTQDAEVQNARVGANGVSYETLKQRLDGEADSVITILNGFKDESLDLGTWVNGRYTWSTGTITPDDTRISTTKKIQFAIGETIHVEVAESYRFAYVGWASGETLPTHYTTTWLTSGDFTTQVPFYCFMLKKANDDTIEPSEGTNLGVYSDYSLVSSDEKKNWDSMIRYVDATSKQMPMVIGALRLDGTFDDSNHTRCRTQNFISSNAIVNKVWFAASTKHKFAYYADADNTTLVAMDANFSTATEDKVVFPTGANYFLTVVGYTDDREITSTTKPIIAYEVSETIVARTDDNGTEYGTLKDRLDTDYNTINARITSEISSVDSMIESLSNEITTKTSIEFSTVIGGLTTQGVPMESTTRVRTYGFVPCNPAIGKVHFSAGTKHRFAYYSQNNTSSFISFSDWSTATEDAVVFPTGASYASMYILVGYTDDRTITTSNKPKIWYDYAAPQGNEVAHVDNYAIRALSANVQPMANFRLSTIIPVKSNTAYRAKKFRNTITLDENFGVVRSLATTDIENDTITTSATEKYIVFCWRNTEDEMYFAEADNYVEGRAISDLVPYPLIGKKLSLLGDSISSYAGTIPEGNDVYYTGSNSGVTDPSQMWWSVLCSKTGMTPLVINGWSGSGITQLTDSAHVNKVPMSSTSRCQALHVDTVTPDVVLIAGGVNDYSYANSAQHNPSNWDGKTAPTSGSSFTETYARMIRDIQEAYPSAIIICLSTFFTQRGTDNGYTYVNGTGYTQPDYDAEIEKVARLMRVGYVNMEQCGFNRYNFYPTFAEDSSTTPTHPNARGQRTMGEYLADVVPQIVNSFTKNKE